jgi:hypothetical protein
MDTRRGETIIAASTLSEYEFITAIHAAEQYLNNIMTEIYKKYGIAIRFRL